MGLRFRRRRAPRRHGNPGATGFVGAGGPGGDDAAIVAPGARRGRRCARGGAAGLAGAFVRRSGWRGGARMNARAPSRPVRPAGVSGVGTAAVALLLALLTAWLAVGGALAQDDRAPVLIDGREVFRVGPLDEIDAGERARLIQRRIDLLLASPDQIGPARVEPPDPAGERAVTVAGVPVVVVTEEDAADNVATVDALAAEWATALDRELGRAAERRQTTLARFIAEIRAAFAAAFVRLYGTMSSLVPRFLAAVLVLALFALAVKVARAVLGFVFARAGINPTVKNLIRSLVAVSIWTAGALAATAAFGFDPQTVVTGLGLTGLALGFGLRDIVSNYVSGVLILVLRPFALGDWIAIGDTEGTVEEIDLRATKIRAFDGALVLIPNGDVFTSRIVKNTEPVRRSSVQVPLAPGADLDRAVTVARRSDVLATEDAARRAAVDALRAAGIEPPTPGVRVVAAAPPGPGGAAP